MIPEEIINLLLRYNSQIVEEISVINLSIERIKDSLQTVNSVIAENLYKQIQNGALEKFDDEQTYLQDSYTLRNFIQTISCINVQYDDHNIPNDDIVPDYENAEDIDDAQFSDMNEKKLDIYNVIVLSTIRKCKHNNHILSDIVVDVPVLYNDGNIRYKSVLVSYCSECKHYVMLKSDYLQIDGIIMCKIIDETTNGGDTNDATYFLEAQKHSVVYNYGYNVNASNNLPAKVRQLILASLVEAKILSRSEIRDHLNSLIMRGKKVKSLHDATRKWQEDRNFINAYKTENLPKGVFNKIILKYSK